MIFTRALKLGIISWIITIIPTPVLSAFQPKAINDTAVCSVGQPLALSPVEESANASCVPLSVRCALTCQRNAPNCTCFNYYDKGSCEFFGGSNVSVAYQPGCTLWAVSLCLLFTVFTVFTVCRHPILHWRESFSQESPYRLKIAASLSFFNFWQPGRKVV